MPGLSSRSKWISAELAQNGCLGSRVCLPSALTFPLLLWRHLSGSAVLSPRLLSPRSFEDIWCEQIRSPERSTRAVLYVPSHCYN